MKVFVGLMCLVACSFGEPPVFDGYVLSRSGQIQHGTTHHQHGSEGQRPAGRASVFGRISERNQQESSPTARSSPSQEYGVPSGRSGLSQEYGVPSGRSSPSQEYGVPSGRSGLSQESGVPSARNSPSQEYGVPSARIGLSQEYGVPTARNSRSQEYGIPTARNNPSQQYGVPLARIGLSQEYGLPSARNSISQAYGVPSTRSGSPSQEYGVPSARNSISAEYGVPSARSGSPSQDYSAPTARSGNPSGLYGAPATRNQALSEEYGVPSANSGYSEDYGLNSLTELSEGYAVPEVVNVEIARANLGASEGAAAVKPSISNKYLPSGQHSSQPSEEYGAPASKSTVSQAYGVPNERAGLQRHSASFFRNSPGGSLNQEYGVPEIRSNDISQRYSRSRKSFRGNAGLSRTYGAPSRSGLTNLNAANSRGANGYSSNVKSLNTNSKARSGSQGYSVGRSSGHKTGVYASSYPSFRGSGSSGYSGKTIGRISGGASDTFIPLAKHTTGRISEKYAVSEKSALGKSSDSYVAAKSESASAKLSDTYRVPVEAKSQEMPAALYGVPGHLAGYNNARGNSLNDLSEQEPANYEFAYKVNDFESGSDFGHKETRQDDKAEGTYYVVLPDGSKQVVEYEADERGFKPRISVEPVDAGIGGYDDNAADLSLNTRTDDGPY